MKCAVHSEVDATGYCRNCGKPLCPACTREVKGALYCEDCLGVLVAATPATPAPGTSHPGVALGLGIIPGLGAVYNGEYMKALIHVVVFAALVGAVTAAGNSDSGGAYLAICIVLLVAFISYMPIDAYRVAKLRQTGGGGPVPLFDGSPTNQPVGAIILIALGMLFLLGNFGLLRGDWFEHGWPIALIALGVWLLFRRTQRPS
jgi:hypothetical protein